MVQASPPIDAVATARSRYWLVVHDGKIHPIDWADGERLLTLSSEIRMGRSASQAFSFQPRGSVASSELVTLQLTPDTPIQLLTQSARTRQRNLSHWFG